MTALELLAPARNADIGIAAIDCGADAVYIAGPGFGARQAAGNQVEDIRRLCEYAHRFGARIFVTFNTIIFESELGEAARQLSALVGAGVDAFIVQDLAVPLLARSEGLRTVFHASTQCAIRSPESARLYSSLGFSRLVLERQLSLAQVGEIRRAVPSELEFFVHGALCVSYSGNCYLSEHLAGRSANRGACVQACRSLYDLTDASGKVLARDKALLSLKDFNLSSRLEELAGAGVCSFKIEGRLKNLSYVCNLVREYSMDLDRLVSSRPSDFRRASFGRIRGGFTPDSDKTFNRGYTQLFISGQRSGGWASPEAAGSLGERIGIISSVRPGGRDALELRVQLMAGKDRLSSGDGFAIVDSGRISGFRGDVCEGDRILCKMVPGLRVGQVLYRNLSSEFEKKVQSSRPKRLISVLMDLEIRPEGEGWELAYAAVSEDGRRVCGRQSLVAEKAGDAGRMEALLHAQLGKMASCYEFSLSSLSAPFGLPLLPAAKINALRREAAEALDRLPVLSLPLLTLDPASHASPLPGEISSGKALTYKANVANSLARRAWLEAGAEEIQPAYELQEREDAELMRSKYCLRHELGLCLKSKAGQKLASRELYLLNNGRRLRLDFDCAACEMTVSQASSRKACSRP